MRAVDCIKALCFAITVNQSVATMKLTSKTFQTTVESGKNGMIKFYQPWCGHCTAMKPAWDELAEKADSSVFIADVDCSKEADLCQLNDVQGYPTIYYYKDGVRENFTGGRSAEDLEKFVIDNLAQSCNPIGNMEESCSEKAQKYIIKWKVKDVEDLSKEIKRLQGMIKKEMAHDLKKWVNERISILKKLVGPQESVMDKAMDTLSSLKDLVISSLTIAMELMSPLLEWVEERIPILKKITKDEF